MAILDEAQHQVVCKIVYHGAGRSGKTTNLLYLNEALPPRLRGRFVTLETPTERTLFFDLLPVSVEAGGYRFRFLLFATPGQEYYHASRRQVLKGADAIVYVMDSARERMVENSEAIELLEKNLRELGTEPELLPSVFQYNKRDLAGALPIEEAERRYNPRRLHAFPATARTGQGVLETFLTAAKMSLARLTTTGREAKLGESFRSVVVTEEDAARAETILKNLAADGGARGALLVDENSAILVSAGMVMAEEKESLGALLACNFTAAQELAGALSGSSFAGTLQRGDKSVLRAARVDARRFLVTVAARQADARKLLDATAYARTALAAQMAHMDSLSAQRFGRVSDMIGAAGGIAIAGLGGR